MSGRKCPIRRVLTNKSSLKISALLVSTKCGRFMDNKMEGENKVLLATLRSTEGYSCLSRSTLGNVLNVLREKKTITFVRPCSPMNRIS
jgi:hypothetical protein